MTVNYMLNEAREGIRKAYSLYVDAKSLANKEREKCNYNFAHDWMEVARGNKRLLDIAVMIKNKITVYK